MLSMTIQRTDAVATAGEPLIVCNEDQRTGVERELTKSGFADAGLILEPVGRNTAPATTVAALQLAEDGSDPILFVMPADHVIRNEQAFSDAVDLAAGFAEEGYLLTFGIDPTGPETGYGYIRFGDRLADGVHVVEDFREKPDAATAEEYISSGRYLWNSGIFMFRASRFLDEIETHAPAVLSAAWAALAGAEHVGRATRLDEAAFAAAPSISIDYAVMEHTTSAAVVPIHTGWSDVGSWTALWEIGQHDEDGNVVIGDVETIDVRNSYVRSSGRLVAAIGVDDIVIVDTPDATLVSRRDRAQDVKAIVDRLESQGRSEVDTDGSELWPWGRSTALDSGPDHQVLRLRIEPGTTMPNQPHQHRSQHWVVVGGEALVHLGGVRRAMSTGDSVTIPAGDTHLVENTSETEPLEIIIINLTTNFVEEEG